MFKLKTYCILFIIALLGMQCNNAQKKASADKPRFSVLVFSKTEGYFHQSIPAGMAAIQKLGMENNFKVDTTINSEYFTDENLSKYDVVVFNNTTRDVLNDEQQEAFKRYMQSGKGYAGIHAATDTEYDWEWYGGLISGAYFKDHPQGQPEAVIVVEDRNHPSTKMLPEKWEWKDEWYNFKENPRGKVRVLASVDESSYEGGNMGDHPIVWCNTYEGGRVWYSGLGHMIEGFKDPLYLQHLLGGIEWAAGVSK